MKNSVKKTSDKFANVTLTKNDQKAVKGGYIIIEDTIDV